MLNVSLHFDYIFLFSSVEESMVKCLYSVIFQLIFKTESSTRLFYNETQRGFQKKKNLLNRDFTDSIY